MLYRLPKCRRVGGADCLDATRHACAAFAERNLITLSLTAEIDEDGRIVLPQKVRDKIEIGANG